MQTKGGKEIAILYIFATLWLAACCVHSRDLERAQNLSISASTHNVPAGPKVQNVYRPLNTQQLWIFNDNTWSNVQGSIMYIACSKMCSSFRSWCLWNLLGFKKLISFDSFCKSIQSLGSLCPWQWTFSKISRSQSDKRVVLQNNESTPPTMEAKYLSLGSWSQGL